MSNFQVNDNWEVLVDGKVIGELEGVDFGEICGRLGEPSAPGRDAAA